MKKQRFFPRKQPGRGPCASGRVNQPPSLRGVSRSDGGSKRAAFFSQTAFLVGGEPPSLAQPPSLRARCASGRVNQPPSLRGVSRSDGGSKSGTPQWNEKQPPGVYAGGFFHDTGSLGEEGLLSDSPRHAIACHPPLRGGQGPLSEGGAACRWHANSTVLRCPLRSAP